MQLLGDRSLIIRPLLTIAVPTYNRDFFLELCLKRISDELLCLSEDWRGLVNVYVSDNASTDGTIAILAKYQSLLKQGIILNSNKENIGADRNIAQCYDSATTPYVWVLGDDDIILPGALSKVLEILYSQKVDILYLNHYWFTNEYVQLETTRKALVISEFNDSLSFARRINVMLTFISGLVVRTGVGLELRQSLISTNLVQLSWVLPLLRDGKKFIVLDNEIVAARGGNSGGYELINTFANNLKEIVDSVLKNKPKVCNAIQNGTIINFFPGFVLELRSGSSKFADIDPWLDLKHVFNKNWRYYFFLVPLIKLPLFLACRYNNLLNIFRRLFVNYLI